MITAEAEKTYVCSVVFLDIVQFSQQANAVQSAWRVELAAILERGLAGMEPDHRIIVDTGDGAAIGFLWNPEDALQFTVRLLAALAELKNFALRVGAHIGPLRVVRGMNGHPNIVGDGINAAQRVMSFAEPNEVLVSRSFHEAVIWLSTGNPELFSPYGKQADKHGREHDLYRMGAKPATQDALSGAADLPTKKSTPATISADITPETTLQASKVATKASSRKPWLFALAACLVIGAGIVASSLPTKQMASGIKGAEVPASTATEAPAAVVTKPISAHAESASRIPHEKKSSTPPRPTAVTVVTDAGAAQCVDCSCSDLMTKLSLGEPLNNKERSYLQQRCKQ